LVSLCGNQKKQQVPPLRFAPVGMTILLQGNGPKTDRTYGC
jgi:hypothetical protein